MYPQSMPVLSKNKKNIKNDEILEFFTTTKTFLYIAWACFRNDTGSVVRLVGELSYLDCLQKMYCCILNSVQ